MKSETENALKSVGWEFAKLVHPSLFFQSWKPDEKGGLLFSANSEAQNQVKNLQTLMKVLGELSPDLRNCIDGFARRDVDWSTGRKLFDDLEAAINSTLDIAEWERENFWKGSGRTPAHSADRIAAEVAKIYVLGLGKMPTCGQKPGTNEPSTKFCRAVQQILKSEHVVGHFYRPCTKAKKYLEKNDLTEFKKLLAIRNRRQRNGLFSLK